MHTESNGVDCRDDWRLLRFGPKRTDQDRSGMSFSEGISDNAEPGQC